MILISQDKNHLRDVFKGKSQNKSTCLFCIGVSNGQQTTTTLVPQLKKVTSDTGFPIEQFIRGALITAVYFQVVLEIWTVSMIAYTVITYMIDSRHRSFYYVPRVSDYSSRVVAGGTHR